MDSLTSTIVNALFTTVVILAILAFLGGLVAIYFDRKAMRLELAQGRPSVWYKRPTLFNSLGMMLMMTAQVISISVITKHLNLLLYVPVFLLMAIALSMIIYGSKLALSRKRL